MADPEEEVVPPKGHLSVLQKEAAHSMFGGRIKLKDGSEEEFVDQIQKHWTQRIVPQQLDTFLRERQAKGVAVPKQKAERAKKFYQVLRSLS